MDLETLKKTVTEIKEGKTVTALCWHLSVRNMKSENLVILNVVSVCYIDFYCIPIISERK
jgi:hypothetical protein